MQSWFGKEQGHYTEILQMLSYDQGGAIETPSPVTNSKPSTWNLVMVPSGEEDKRHDLLSRWLCTLPSSL